MATKSDADYVQALNPKGYLNNREITNLDGQFLVKGSQDCEIINQEKVAARPGFTVVGDPKTKNAGHHSSADWETNTGVHRSLRLNDDGELEVYWKHAWYLLKEYAANTHAEFYPWWSSTELLDFLLYVVGGHGIEMWSGGIAEIASATASTVTLQKYLSGTSYNFHDNGADPDTITDSLSGFVTAGFVAGDTILVTGSVSNDGTYTVKTVTAGTLTLFAQYELTDESGPTVVIKAPGATWAESRFLTSGTRSVRINGNEYDYTGGEGTGTLTGLSGVAGVSFGDLALQAIRSTDIGDFSDNYQADLISVTGNYVFVGSKKSRVVYVSKSTDYTDFTFTTPLRKPTEGFVFNLDSTPTAFSPDEGLMYAFARRDDAYKIVFTLSADFASETISFTKGKTATGQAAVSQGAVVNIKNAVAFVSFEPTVDTLGNVAFFNDSPQAVPISDPIKNDIEAYDTTDVHGMYANRDLWYTFPAEGILQIYNTQYGYWQPPWHLDIGRFALIDLEGDGKLVLCGHSASTNETYRLRDGWNDNGAPRTVIMAFGYENYGARFTPKSFDEAATELYMSENTEVTDRIIYDYKGSTDIREFPISGGDSTIVFTPNDGYGIGHDPLGDKPLGSLIDEPDDMRKVRVVNMTTVKDFFERQRVYYADGIDARFEIIAYGENVELGDNIPTYLKR